MKSRREFILRIIACLIACALFLMLAFTILNLKLEQAGIGAAKIPARELVGIAYFRALERT